MNTLDKIAERWLLVVPDDNGKGVRSIACGSSFQITNEERKRRKALGEKVGLLGPVHVGETLGMPEIRV